MGILHVPINALVVDSTRSFLASDWSFKPGHMITLEFRKTDNLVK
jgi:hypothetical protein